MSPSPEFSSTTLVQNEIGVWVSPEKRHVSYPEAGNADCFEFEERSFWFNHRNRVITSLARQFPPQGTIYDVGGGNGYVSLALEQAGFSAAVVEPGETGAANARRRGLTSICSTLEDAGLDRESLPAIGLFDVLEHVEDEASLLATLYQHLIPGGLLFVTVPALKILWSPDDDYSGHFRRYTTASLNNSLMRAGFQVDRCSWFFWFLPLPVFLLRTIPGWFGAGRQTVESARQNHRPVGRVVTELLDLELRRIDSGRGMPCGSSCFAVARRPVSDSAGG